MITDNLTIIIVSYNRMDLLQACVNSIRKFYPQLKIMIIDGSPIGSECYNYCKELMLKNYYMIVLLGRNVGHGVGMKKGIGLSNTKYFLLMDSDTELKLPCLESMMQMFRPGMYGIGEVVMVNEQGSNGGDIHYLHPYFAMISKEEYLRYDPIINHGAPMIKAMLSIKRESLLANLKDIKNVVWHKERGTRSLNPKEFNPGNWDKI